MGQEPVVHAPIRPTDFFHGDEKEPHALRRGEILKKHPEVKQLMTYEWRTKYLVLGSVSLQMFMVWLTVEWRWPAFLASVYVVGATLVHSLMLAIHEISHNLGASTMWKNKLLAIFANLPFGIPYCITFKPYHMEHHRCQGEDLVDTDIPSRIEAYLITGSAINRVDHTVRKAIFMFFQIFAYAFRPMCIKPNLVPVDRWIVLNWAVQLTFDGLVVRYFGPQYLLYMLLSVFFAGSIHPTAGHFLAEHYVVDGVAETYSYYGPLNYLCYNVGYHNEHHDFPNIPWSKLPEVRKIAPEYYDNLPQCHSWPGLIFRYIFDDTLSPYSRVKRSKKNA
jgi:sphingolipid delta-4 desaturase